MSKRVLYWDEVLRKQLERDATPLEEVELSTVSKIRPDVPASVSLAQARLALLEAGKLDGLTPAIDSIPDDIREATRIKWEYGPMVRRADPSTDALGKAFGMTSDEMDDLFITASGL